MPILSMHFIHERATMHHDKSKKVLFLVMDAGEIARETGMGLQKVSETVKRGMRKLLEERNKRKAPFIDRTFYTSLNGMMITAYMKAFRLFKNSKLKDFALKSLTRILEDHFINNELLHTEGVTAILDDYIYLIEALVSSYEVTGDKNYFNKADKLMQLCMEKFWDKEQGGFFDTDREVLGIRLKAIEDIPHPSANALSIILMLKLHAMTEKKKYYLYAQESLKAFSLKAKDIGIQSGYYYCALDAYFNMMKLTLQTKPADKLAGTALTSFYPYMSIVYGEDRGYAVPCIRETCYEPINKPESLKIFCQIIGQKILN
ncbi:MAG: thioredoxin domain-containing protein [Nitrospirae bacterium]|nr:thioredoxin domain-containing protein [Nitrospirota bacterium]